MRKRRSAAPIAERSIWVKPAAGPRRAVTIRIGKPYQVGRADWACPVALVGLHAKLDDVHGADSFQALMLAQNLARTMLGYFIEDGGAVLSGRAGKPTTFDSLFVAGVLGRA